MATNKTAPGGAEPGTAIGNQGSDGGPAGGGPAAKKPEGTGQKRSKERPGKRAHQGGSSAWPSHPEGAASAATVSSRGAVASWPPAQWRTGCASSAVDARTWLDPT